MNELSIFDETKEIFKMVCENVGLQQIINYSSKIINYDIYYFDINIDIKASSNNKTQVIKDITSIQYLRDLLLKIEAIDNNSPFIIFINDNKKILISKCYYNGGYIGHIAIPELKTGLEDINLEKVSIISDACAISFALTDRSRSLDLFSHPENAIFEELIQGNYNTISDFNSISKNLSFKNYNKFCTLCFIVDSKLHKNVIKQIIDATINIKFGFWTSDFNNNIAALIGWNNNKHNLKDILWEIEEICILNNIKLGIGDPYFHILQTRQNYLNAERATILSKSSESSKHIFYYDDYKFNVFISDMNLYIENSLDYLSFKVMDILKYDQEYNTEYALTLKTFLSASQSPQTTADILFIHKNTVIYRINKIKELFHIDFSNTAQNFQLYFSFQLLVARGWGKVE